MKTFFTKLKKIIFFISFSIVYSSNLYSQELARAQFIHNAADASVAVGDIYFDNILVLNDFEFRDATPYFDVPGGVPIKVSIAPSTSISSAESIHDTTFTFTIDSKNVIMISGVNGTGFQANPDGKNTGIQFFLAQGTKDISSGPTVAELTIVHGVTDAAPVDILVEGQPVMWDNIGYGGYSGYKELATAGYTVHITEFTGANPDTLGSFSADLSQLGGLGVVVFASGFLTPADDNNGPAFGLFAALPDGTVVPLTNVVIAGLFKSLNTFAAISAYPVPSAGNITLEINNDQAGAASIEVINMFGQVMDAGTEVFLFAGKNQIQMNMSNLNTGEYLIKIVSADKAGAIRCSLRK